jgi:hypothetical protein
LAVFMYRRFRRIIKLQSIPHIIQLNIVQWIENFEKNYKSI